MLSKLTDQIKFNFLILAGKLENFTTLIASIYSIRKSPTISDEIAPVARNLPRLAVENYASGDSDEEESSNKNSVVDRHPILQFVQGPHRTIVDTSQLDEEHGEVAEDEPHAEAETDQDPRMAKAQYQHREGPEIVEPLSYFLWSPCCRLWTGQTFSRAMPSRFSTGWRS